MAASSVGSDIFAVLALVLISIIVLLLIRHFLPLRTTPSYLLVPVFLALALPISTILLVPIDLASSSREPDEAARGIWLPEAVMRATWRITYWLLFALTWFILPLLGEYFDSGYRSPKDRFVYSLKSNARYYGIVILCGAAGLAYVLVQNGFSASSLKSLVMALAYSVGLVQAIYMMGHGLVAVPRRLFRDADGSKRLRRLQIQAVKVHDRMEDSLVEMAELDDQVGQLRQRKNAISRDHQEWVEELVDIAPLYRARAARAVLPPESGPAIPAVITDRYLADLGRRLNRTRHKRARFIDAWDRLVQQAADTQAIIDSRASHRLDFEAPPSWSSSVFGRKSLLSPYMRYVLYVKVVPAMEVSLGAVLSLASVCIVWSELVKFAAPWLSIISLTVVHQVSDTDVRINFAGQVVASLWIFYMCFAVLASFGDVKVWGNRALVRRNTYGESACWYAGQCAKLTVPLTYNFLTFIPPAIHERTTFYHFLGKLINLTPLGEWFDYLFPMLILIPVCATLFGLYGRVRKVFDFGIVDEEEGEERDTTTAFGTGGWREGRDLIEQELNGRSNLESSTLLGGGGGGGGGGSHRHQPSSSSRRAGGASSRDGPPTLYIPPADSSSSSSGGTTRSPPSRVLSPASRRSQQQPASQARRLAAARGAVADEEERELEDENVFSGFAHRLQNTLDNVNANIERSEWFERRPKWLGGAGGGSGAGGAGEGGGGGESGRADAGRGLGRWFGGRPADGRVRL